MRRGVLGLMRTWYRYCASTGGTNKRLHTLLPNFCGSECAGRVSGWILSSRRRIAEFVECCS